MNSMEKEIGLLIKKERANKNLTITELADLAGLYEISDSGEKIYHKAVIIQYESGFRALRSSYFEEGSNLSKILNATGMKPLKELIIDLKTKKEGDLN